MMASFGKADRTYNPVFFLLGLLGIACIWAFPLMKVAPNQIMPGVGFFVQAYRPITWLGFIPLAWFKPIPFVWLIILFCFSAIIILGGGKKTQSIWGYRAVFCFSLVLLILLFASVGGLAKNSLQNQSPYAQVSLGAGFWLGFFTSFFCLVEALRLCHVSLLSKGLFWGLLVCSLFFFLYFGSWDSINVVKVYYSHQDKFKEEFIRHLWLVIGALVPALCIGLPLGYLAWFSKRLDGPIFSVLNFIQTIPSLALFILLMAPLSKLGATFGSLKTMGVGGTGPAPALIALCLYALLPIVHSIKAGLGCVPPSVEEASMAMGMGPFRRLFGVQLPIGLPVFFAGFRTTIILLIGLTTVGALVGAGGLGRFILEGLGSQSMGLILLGAIPVVGLALVTNQILLLVEYGINRAFLKV